MLNTIRIHILQAFLRIIDWPEQMHKWTENYDGSNSAGCIHETLIVRTPQQIDKVQQEIVAFRICLIGVFLVQNGHDPLDPVVVLGDRAEHVSGVAADTQVVRGHEWYEAIDQLVGLYVPQELLHCFVFVFMDVINQVF